MQMYSKFEGCPPVLLVALELKGCEYVHKLVLFFFVFVQHFNFKSPLVLNLVLFFFPASDHPSNTFVLEGNINWSKHLIFVIPSDFWILLLPLFELPTQPTNTCCPANCSRFCPVPIPWSNHHIASWRLKTFVA